MFSSYLHRFELTKRHGDGGKAHDLSVEGKRHQADQDRLDDQASDWIFNGTRPFLSVMVSRLMEQRTTSTHLQER